MGEICQGVVIRPSLARHVKAKFQKGHKNVGSSFGKIRAVKSENSNEIAKEELQKHVENDVQQEVAAQDEQEDHEKASDIGGPGTYNYNISDLADQKCILRPGDLVNFVLIGKGKSRRASKVALVSSQAKTGIVKSLDGQMDGMITIVGEKDVDDSVNEEIPFVSHTVLNGAKLSVGDQVQFGLSKSPTGDWVAGYITLVQVRIAEKMLCAILLTYSIE